MLNNYNNPALNQLNDILKVIRNQMAMQTVKPYFHYDQSYVDLNLKLLNQVGDDNHLPTYQLGNALTQFERDDDYQYVGEIFYHLDHQLNDYAESQWTLNDLNQIIGMLTPIVNIKQPTK